MADNKNINNNNIPLDINELASLNNDISVDFIEQLQSQLSEQAKNFGGDSSIADLNLFEEIPEEITSEHSVAIPDEISNEQANIDESIKESSEIQEPINNDKSDVNVKKTVSENLDDNFIKKYKAKLKKQQNVTIEENTNNNSTIESNAPVAEGSDIGELTGGNIIERPLTEEQTSFNESLDYIDGNVKYSKYVIYINPENVEYIESLTVKERKNLINKVLKEQSDIAITKIRFKKYETILRHLIVAILTIAISIPIVYFVINASLESSINNYRKSQNLFKVLYKEQGKIKRY